MEIKYSQELLKDFSDLLVDFNFFMSMNLIHADLNLAPACQARVRQLIHYSLDNNSSLVDVFHRPLVNYGNNENMNKERLVKNFNNLMAFLHRYLEFAEPILKECKPDIYNERFRQIKTRYVAFRAKYRL